MDLVLGINLRSLMKFLKSKSSTSTIRLEYEQHKTELELTVSEGQTENKYTVKLIEVHHDSDEIPEQAYDCFFNIDTKVLKDTIQSLKDVGNSFTLKCKRAGINFCNLDNHCVNMDRSAIAYMEMQKPCSGKFSIAALHKFVEQIPLDSPLHIFMGHQLPLNLDVLFYFTGNISFYVAGEMENVSETGKRNGT